MKITFYAYYGNGQNLHIETSKSLYRNNRNNRIIKTNKCSKIY